MAEKGVEEQVLAMERLRKKNTQHSVCSLSVCEAQYYPLK